MAELEAVFRDNNTKSVKGWRHPLAVDTPVKIGRLPTDADWWMPDGLISSWHCTVTWDGDRLQVDERPEPRPVNRIFYRRQPVTKFAISPGESFVIGNTVFTLHDRPVSSNPSVPDLADAAAPAEATFTRDQLRGERHRDPAAILSALESLPDVLRLATNEEVLFRQMVHTILAGVPLASAAAVLACDPAGEVRVRYHQQRLRLNGGDRAFTPSRKLVRRSLLEQRQSVVYVWDKGDPSADGNSGMTIGAHVNPQVGFPWAICTPFQDESGLGLYVDGVMDHPPQVRGGKVDDDLRDYLKLVELIASLIEATMKGHDLERNLSIVRQFIPKRVRGTINPRKLEEVLRPRVATVTVLFCDIRGSVQIAQDGGADLEATWKRVSAALDEMTQVITMNDGVVAGFQGDAVMAFWGWPDDQKDQILKAAQTALRIRDRFDQYGWYKDLSCGIGLAHGPAMAGKLGAHDLAKVDVFGPTVNLASRLESLTKQFGVRILIDEAVANGLKAAGTATGQMIGRIRQLGRFKPAGMEKVKGGVAISELMPLAGQAGGEMPEPARRKWEDAIKTFVGGDWPRARTQLELFFPDEKVTKLIGEYIDETGTAPPADWDGAITLKSK
jgi:adenylate cyclase